MLQRCALLGAMNVNAPPPHHLLSSLKHNVSTVPTKGRFTEAGKPGRYAWCRADGRIKHIHMWPFWVLIVMLSSWCLTWCLFGHILPRQASQLNSFSQNFIIIFLLFRSTVAVKLMMGRNLSHTHTHTKSKVTLGSTGIVGQNRRNIKNVICCLNMLKRHNKF